MDRRILWLLAALFTLAAAWASHVERASATTTPRFLIGIDDEEAVRGSSDTPWWSQAFGDANAGAFRFMVNWSRVAPRRPADPTDPTDPAYDWTEPDRAARFAGDNGLELLFSSFCAPMWAEGANRPKTGYGRTGLEAPAYGAWDPKPNELNRFAIALARRYGGTTNDPRRPGSKLIAAKLYEAWNEPNLKAFLAPQYDAGGKLVAVEKYRLLLNAFYDGVKSVQPDASVSAGGLGPYGSSSQGAEIQPQLFARNLFCLTKSSKGLKAASCPVKAKLDAFAIHPYTFFGTPTTRAFSSDGGAFGNTPDFKTALDYAASKGTLLPAGPKQLWATEFGWLTNPPGRPGGGTSIGVPPAAAALYTSEGIYRLWSWGVSKVFYFHLRDLAEFPAALYFWPDGAKSSSEATPKPALRAFRFPLMAIGTVPTIKVWAHSPCAGSGSNVSIHASVRARWREVTTLVPDSNAIVSGNVRVPIGTSRVRGVATGPGCSQRSVSMPISRS